MNPSRSRRNGARVTVVRAAARTWTLLDKINSKPSN
jgi:hypothetical protein